MIQGKVRWFCHAKGFGFISQCNGDDIYFHYTSVISQRMDALCEGQDVTFDLLETGIGLEASNVSVLSYR